MTLTPATLRHDAPGLACGQGHIPRGHKCHKGGAFPTGKALAAGVTLAALGVGAYTLSHRGRGSSGATPAGPPRLPGSGLTPQPRLPGLTPRALLAPAPPRKSKTQRMRENTAAAISTAEGRIAQTAREEVRRIGQIGNTMAAAGEAAGMATKTTLRELRLRTEAARRRYEPGYRAPRQATPRPPAQLPEGGTSAFQVPFNPPQSLTPDRVRASVDPRTGQPRRRKAQGFGRRDNYIPTYAPVRLSLTR